MSVGGQNEPGTMWPAAVSPTAELHLPDVEHIIEAFARRASARMSEEAMPLAIAFEIREMFPESRLLVGVGLNEGKDRIEIDILGLVEGRKLAIKLAYGTGRSRALEEVRRVCAVEPGLTGLVIALVDRDTMPKDLSYPWLGWRTCQELTGAGKADLAYAFAWVPSMCEQTEGAPEEQAQGISEQQLPRGGGHRAQLSDSRQVSGVWSREEVQLWGGTR